MAERLVRLRRLCKVNHLVRDNDPPRCPSCGGELKWKADLPLFSTTPDAKFFQCKSCDRFHTAEIKARKPDPTL